MGAHRKTAPERIETTERRAQAVRLRIGGMTYTQIGQALKISEQAACKLVHGALDDYRKDCAEQTEKLREIDLRALDVMQAAKWGDIVKGDNLSIDRVLRIMQRRADLLGLDAPVRQELTGANGIPVVPASGPALNLSHLSDGECVALAGLMRKAQGGGK